MTTDNEGLLSRWSRRKLQSKQLSEQEDEQLEQSPPLADELLDSDEIASPQVAEIENEPLLTDEDMPDIESLNEDSDYSVFMSSGVSDKLRNLALKKMFQAPVFHIRDGLDDYDEDYTTFEALGDIVTCDMKHQIELEARKKLQAELDAASEMDDDKTEQLSEDEADSSIDTTEVDITETDITEELSSQDNTQQGSSISSQSDSPKNTAENRQYNE